MEKHVKQLTLLNLYSSNQWHLQAYLMICAFEFYKQILYYLKNYNNCHDLD